MYVFISLLKSKYTKVVGKWFNGLELNMETVVWNREQEMPTSACSLPCEVGMIKKQQVIQVLIQICTNLFNSYNLKFIIFILRVIHAAGSATVVRRTSMSTMSLPAETAGRDFGRIQISSHVFL